MTLIDFFNLNDFKYAQDLHTIYMKYAGNLHKIYILHAIYTSFAYIYITLICTHTEQNRTYLVKWCTIIARMLQELARSRNGQNTSWARSSNDISTISSMEVYASIINPWVYLYTHVQVKPWYHDEDVLYWTQYYLYHKSMGFDARELLYCDDELMPSLQCYI